MKEHKLPIPTFVVQKSDRGTDGESARDSALPLVMPALRTKRLQQYQFFSIAHESCAICGSS